MKYFSRIFSKAKDVTTDTSIPAFSQKLEQVQRKLADHLNGRAGRVSASQLKIVLLIFCLFAGGYSAYLIARAFAKANSPPEYIKILHRPPVGPVK